MTDLIIAYCHRMESHTGILHFLTAVIGHYWMVKENCAVSRVIKRCAACRRMNALIGQQLTAPLLLCWTE